MVEMAEGRIVRCSVLLGASPRRCLSGKGNMEATIPQHLTEQLLTDRADAALHKRKLKPAIVQLYYERMERPARSDPGLPRRDRINLRIEELMMLASTPSLSDMPEFAAVQQVVNEWRGLVQINQIQRPIEHCLGIRHRSEEPGWRQALYGKVNV